VSASAHGGRPRLLFARLKGGTLPVVCAPEHNSRVCMLFPSVYDVFF